MPAEQQPSQRLGRPTASRVNQRCEASLLLRIDRNVCQDRLLMQVIRNSNSVFGLVPKGS